MSLLHQASEQLDGSAGDFQEGINSNVRKDLKGGYRMDAAQEDRICDLYDLYVDGMDEDKGPQSRKLYVQVSGESVQVLEGRPHLHPRRTQSDVGSNVVFERKGRPVVIEFMNLGMILCLQ
uniref:Uncharacterized protein n=1 Tax=Ananas comosus var. bracteatus TaxID=296719 RepID=A0A6V7P541_ANACO|nr:unnamed protein product [Ananas comosus var. bracteatus]